MGKRSRKKKSLIIVIVLVVALAVLAAVLIVDKINYDKYLEENAGQQESAASFSSKEVEYISYTTAEHSVAFVKDDDVWYLESDRDFPVDQSGIKTLLNCLCIITATNVVTDVTDLAQYGLEEPFATVYLREADGDEGYYAVGDKNTFLDNYYFHRPDLAADVVYTVNNNVASVVKHDLLYWIELESMPIFTNVTSVSVTDPNGGVTEITCQLSENEEEAPQWYYGAKPIAREDISAFEENLKYFDWQDCMVFRPTTEQWEEYGLSEGYYTLAITFLDFSNNNAETTCEVIVSRDGQYGAYAGETDRIYTLTTDLLTYWLGLRL